LLQSRKDQARTLVYPFQKNTALRDSAEAFIRQQYWVKHQAILTQVMATLFGLIDAKSAPFAVVGLNTFRDRSSLVERYLDAPIEEVVSIIAGRDVPRIAIAEVGNLAADGILSSSKLIVFLLGYLHAKGFTHAVCTGTDAVRLSLRRCRVPFAVVGSADANRLGEERWLWGSYYDHSPQVLVIDIAQGLVAVSKRYNIIAPLSGHTL
jgi:hypothetical protein